MGKTPAARANPVGSTFNIQNSIPHKSQKTKAASETNRAKEFQRGTAGVPESAKEGETGPPEGSDIGLGPGCREFESRHSDQNRQFSLRKLAVLHYFEYQNLEILPSRILYIARTCSSDIFSVRIRYISFLRSYKKTCKAFSALSNIKEYSSIK